MATDREGRVLFCPFCREAFEGEQRCPEHELELVEFDRLPKQPHERTLPGVDEPVGLGEWRYGRAEMAIGALMLLVAFMFAPLVTQYVGTRDPLAWTGLALALGPARNFWTAPFVGVMFVYFLQRRRTPRQMRGTRLAGLFLSVMPCVALAWSLRNVWLGAEAARGGIRLELSWGIAPIAIACVLLLVGSLRFGSMPPAPPHGSGPDDDSPPIAR